jgi:hypothetical protein
MQRSVKTLYPPDRIDCLSEREEEEEEEDQILLISITSKKRLHEPITWPLNYCNCRQAKQEVVTVCHNRPCMQLLPPDLRL